MQRSKDGSSKKNVGSSSRKCPFRTEQNLSICLTPAEIWFLITCFRLSMWLMLAPTGRDLDTCLKPLNWGRGYKKASGVWADQTRNPDLHPVATKCARKTHKGKKKSEENSRIIWRHFRRPKMQARFDPNHKTWQLHLSGMQQHSQELMIPGASPLPRGPPAYTLGASGCWRHQPWTHKIHVQFFWLMLWTSPWATFPLQHGDSSICPSLPHDSGGPGDALRHGGATEVPFVDGKVPPSYILAAVTVKTFQGAKRASLKAALLERRIENEPWGTKESSLQETGLSLRCLLQWNQCCLGRMTSPLTS